MRRDFVESLLRCQIPITSLFFCDVGQDLRRLGAGYWDEFLENVTFGYESMC